MAAGAAGDRVGDLGEAHRAGVAVDERDAVDEEAGAEGAEEEVLHRGFLAQQPAPARQSAEQVQREREHLERHEHGEQVVGRREHHHPGDREHHQREDLGVLQPLGRGQALRLGAGQGGSLAGERRHPALEPALGEEQHAEQGQPDHQPPEEQGGPVDRECALCHHLAGVAGPAQDAEVASHQHRVDAGGQQAEQREHCLDQVAALPRRERLDQHAERGRAEHDQQRGDERVLDLRGVDGHDERDAHLLLPSPAPASTAGAGSLLPTWLSVSRTVGLSTDSSGLG